MIVNGIQTRVKSPEPKSRCSRGEKKYEGMGISIFEWNFDFMVLICFQFFLVYRTLVSLQRKQQASGERLASEERKRRVPFRKERSKTAECSLVRRKLPARSASLLKSLM